ncbi:GyrI-like domain-containing protein [Candidatus Amarolinea aalborgensis]|uniref:GyrI-like domain-containing protein n=1 Tax=Candidatus Amarolinea aalborgensis TaxID=2249329 RepID=UPI003BF9D7A3
MPKMDLRKELKYLYAPSARQVALVDVPEFQFAQIDGAIEPGQAPGTSPAFEQAMSALYGITYTLKFMSKQRADNPLDYTVMTLEGLWWVEEGEFNITQPGNWRWTVMILQPDHITPAMFAEGLAQLRKKRGDSPALDKLRLARFHEGLALQIMHIGPYANEPATIARMDAFAQENGYRMIGKHHEIYLGDPRNAAPEKLKTILRHPVALRS